MQSISDLLTEASKEYLGSALFLAFNLETDAILLLTLHVHPREAAFAEEVGYNKKDRLQIISPGLFTTHVRIQTQVHVGSCYRCFFLVNDVPA